MRVINAKGSNYEAGFSVGKNTSEEIKRFIKDFSLTKKDKQKVSVLLPFCKKTFPQFVDEIMGLSDGSGVAFEKLFALNLGLYKAVGCTTIAVKKKGKVLIGHNEDLSHDDMFLLRLTNRDGSRSLSICYYGFLPGFSATINSHGLFQSMNSLDSKEKNAVGLPVSIISRATMEAKTIEEAVSIITMNKRLGGGNFVFYQKDRIVNIETTANRHVVREQEALLAHTNHYLEADLKRFEGREDLYNSVSRLIQARTMLSAGKARNFRSFKKILSSHFDFPNSICRHLKHPGQTFTAGTVLMDTSKKQLKACRGYPCVSRFKTYKL